MKPTRADIVAEVTWRLRGLGALAALLATLPGPVLCPACLGNVVVTMRATFEGAPREPDGRAVWYKQCPLCHGTRRLSDAVRVARSLALFGLTDPYAPERKLYPLGIPARGELFEVMERSLRVELADWDGGFCASTAAAQPPFKSLPTPLPWRPNE